MYQKFDLKHCDICPRKCGVNRTLARGMCRALDKTVVSRAALHFWEEPPISGTRGSGAVFFSGCSLGCSFCQNAKISKSLFGKEYEPKELSEIFRRLEGEGAENINLVTASHFALQVLQALEIYKPKIPVVFNCGGYETVETLKALEGAIDVWLPDFKYADKLLSAKLSKAEDYPIVCVEAIGEMLRQQSKCIYDGRGILKNGVIIRHLVLPDCVDNSKSVLDIIKNKFGTATTISLMSQYTPMVGMPTPFDRKLKPLEYKIVTAYALKLGFEKGFFQECESCGECFVPEFSGQLV